MKVIFKPFLVLFLPCSNEQRERAAQRLIRSLLDRFPESPLVAQKHKEHVSGDSVIHLFKGTPLVDLPDEYKLKFVNSWAGRAVEAVMKEKQDYLGEWKITKIVEAAGSYNETKMRKSIANQISSSDIVMYSFVDCPWCVAAKQAVTEYLGDSERLAVIDLEQPLGREGKAIRAELAKRTGRTSMPCIFVNKQAIRGYTDGAPCGVGLKALIETGQLEEILPRPL